MKKLFRGSLFIFSLFLAMHATGQGQNLGVGVRLGDPSGLSVKKYFGNNKAFEVNLGRSHMFYSGSWYNKRFYDWYDDWDHRYEYGDYQYIGYSRSFPLAIQMHYLIQNDIKQVRDLQWYWGVGGQFRFQTYHFDYRYRYPNSSIWFVGREKVTDIDFGLDGVIGLEYKIPSVPLSVFGDMNLFMEFVDNPFAFWLQGGVGLRYNF